ncbi:hypothetical protein GSI_14368 [Ganoderma sinense ZZ0214-1]|uniref:Uncharacterized protein n=1 Tax=Ganoderma sinense ZZ0214-1 TaxID=1077348 RepID=A0A2G8RNI4_9APHY|nr:hypothetical protein GSI_14368 [Ganoderma sinense ZZ0214-1]
MVRRALVRKSRNRIVRLYAESLEQQVGAAVALKTRFFSEAEDRGSESPAVLEERRGSVEAFLAALQARTDAIERELEFKLKREKEQARAQEFEKEAAASPSENPAPELPVAPVPTAPNPAPTPAPAPNPSDSEPPAYPILDVPHPPCACTADSSDTRPEPRGPPGRCTALRVRDGERCTWTCRSGQRFCVIHCVAHGTVVVSHKVKEGMLEAHRMRLVRRAREAKRASGTGSTGEAEAEGAAGDRDKVQRMDVKVYIDQLEEMIGVVEEHQRLFSCRSPESHATVLHDLKQRRTSAALLLGRLSGRTDAARTAENQGQAETWAAEFLAEVKHKDALERRKAVEDIVTGAIVGGATAWFGVPWARSAVAGVVSPIVVRKARDASEKS